VDSMEEVTRLREGLVVLDEIQIYLNARNWDKLPPQFMLFLQQHRKRSLDILGATQSVKRADVVLRELVQVYYKVNKVVSFTIPKSKLSMGFFYLREYDPDTMERGGDKTVVKPIGWPWPIFADPFTLSVYNTMEEYMPEELEGKIVQKEYFISTKPVQVETLRSTKVLT